MPTIASAHQTTTVNPTLRTRRHPLDAIRLLRTQIFADVREYLRVPEFMVGVVAVPIILYAMFGSTTGPDPTLPDGTPVAAMMAGSFAAYGIVSLAIFTFGVDVASERGTGWLRTRRVTPLPAWSYFGAKIVMAILFSAMILIGVTTLAVTMGNVILPIATWSRLWITLLSGAVVFSTLGFAIAYLARARAASAIGNLIFLRCPSPPASSSPWANCHPSSPPSHPGCRPTTTAGSSGPRSPPPPTSPPGPAPLPPRPCGPTSPGWLDPSSSLASSPSPPTATTEKRPSASTTPSFIAPSGLPMTGPSAPDSSSSDSSTATRTAS